MKNRLTILLLLCLGVSMNVSAQDEEKKKEIPQDGFYRRNIREDAKPYEYPDVNINSVKFYKRIWRDIDLDDTANYILATPGESLMALIVQGIDSGDITAFDAKSTPDNPTGDGFTQPLTPKQAMSRLADSVLVPIFDENGNQIASEMMLNDFNPQSIRKFRVKEDIFFDKQRSRVETRIIGIAPLIHIDAAGELLAEQPVFWLYFPECRELFVKKKVINPDGKGANLSFDDVFVQHKFKSTIVKESNPAELSIKDYVEGEGKTKEAERIEKSIEEYKESIWEY